MLDVSYSQNIFKEIPCTYLKLCLHSSSKTNKKCQGEILWSEKVTPLQFLTVIPKFKKLSNYTFLKKFRVKTYLVTNLP